MIKSIVEKNEKYKEYLFPRGFLVSTDGDIDTDAFPFYSLWKKASVGGLVVYTHPKTSVGFGERDGKACIILGNAYNPFTMQHEESAIADDLLGHVGAPDFFERASELTGVFALIAAEGGKVTFITDPSGMQSLCYGTDGGKLYISSHPQLVADIKGYEMDEFVKELVEYKWYSRVMGPYLPADMCPYKELKRVVPNIAYTFDKEAAAVTHRRFYPLENIKECESEAEYDEVIKAAADILRRNMLLVTKKWARPCLSLTGGIDSNTTFAAANGVYDKIHTFSYCSAEKETIDCEAAEKIAGAFGVEWTLYRVPESNEEIEDFDDIKAILDHNNGYVASRYDNETRKRIILERECNIDVEVKSWASETIRGYWYKHYGRKKMPKLSPKLFRNLYKIFIFNRPLAHKVDKIFAKYIDEFEYEKIPAQYPPADMHYNEVTWGSWGGLNISEMKFCFDITIIYNNRRFFDLLFRVPLERRISDKHHLDMKKYLNEELYDMNIRVVNMKETKFRARALNAIFTLNSILPF